MRKKVKTIFLLVMTVLMFLLPVAIHAITEVEPNKPIKDWTEATAFRWYGIGEEIETSVFVTKIEDGEMYQGYIPEVSRSYDAAGQCSVSYRGIIYWTPRSTYQLPLEVE